MINKKQIQESINSLEDVKGLYTLLDQATIDTEKKNEFNAMLEDIERHYQYLNTMLISFKQAEK